MVVSSWKSNTSSDMKKATSTEIPLDDSSLLTAARRGDLDKLVELLSQTKTGEPFTCAQDWTFGFSDLIKCDHNSQSALHLAASIGNHETAFECVTVLLDNDQIAYEDEEHGDYEKKSKYFIDLKDKYGETALHVAIENKAARVVAHLIARKAAVTLKSKDGIQALTLIYQRVPDAMKELYDGSVELSDDFKRFHLDFGSIIGYHYTLKDLKDDAMGEIGTNSEFQRIPIHEFEHKELDYWRETEYLSLILQADKWGASLLQHSLVKLFLHLKWKKIQSFFYMSFFFHTIWLLLYATAFVDLHMKVNNNTGDCRNAGATSIQCQSNEDLNEICYSLWYIVLILTLLTTAKEVYQAWSMRWNYISFENFTQVLFILFYFLQFGYLMAGHAKIVASISVIGIILSTILMILNLGKTPYFGLQVAALTKVVYSCKPHMILFIVWFIGFGLAFWALFYKTEEFSILRMPAIVTGMAVGELSIGDLMQKLGTQSLSIQILSVLCLVLFIVIIVTLYFNLLIGYAVSDIQLLKSKAEVLDLSNRLATIHTIESFLLSQVGQQILHGISAARNRFIRKEKNADMVTSNDPQSESPFEFLFVIPPEKFKTTSGQYEVKFEDIPEKILGPLKEIAYNNLLKYQ